MATIKQLELEIEKIKQRNSRVEADKAWETSLARKLLIAILTYFVIAVFFFFAGLQNPLVNAVVPTAAFVLSTLSLPLFKKIWLESYKK